MPIMEDDPDNYVKTITEVIKEPREDKKSGGVIKLTCLNIPLHYWIALEPKPQPDSKEREDKVNA